MNSHFGYECDYNYVVGSGDYNEDVYQGWDNQRWEEPYAYDQSNGYGESTCDFQEPPPYAYDPYPQHNSQPYSQTSSYQPPSYDPNPYPSHQPTFEPYEPYMEPPQYQPF